MPRPVLVLDLDETLLHTDGRGRTFPRPYLTEFLESVSRDYEVLVFTFGTRRYALHVCHTLGITHWVPENRIFSRESGVLDPISRHRKKRFEAIICPSCISRCIAVDDSPEVWDAAPFDEKHFSSPHQVIRIPRFYHSSQDISDNSLQEIAEMLHWRAQKVSSFGTHEKVS
jgi:TFIIF-interacting CTD phosphatase-like protein